jgi:hypothetical protein
MSDVQIFCSECWTGLYGAMFCPQCGTLSENAAAVAGVSAVNGKGYAAAATAVIAPPAPPIVPNLAPPQTPGPSHASAAGPTRRPGRMSPSMLGGLADLLLIAVAVAVVLLLVLVLSSGGGGPSYANQAKAALGPVIGANRQLTGSLSSLRSPGSAASARSTVRSTLSTVQAAQQKLSTLKPGSGDERFATAAQAALSSEQSFLNAADIVLGNPSSAPVANLATLGNDTNTELLALDVDVRGASASFPGGSAISTWAQRQTAATSPTASLRAFATRVDSLLSQSTSSFQATNRVFGQVQTAAQGGVATMTLAQAEASIGNVISNRNALAASAAKLPAPTELAGRVRTALVASFNDSLTDDTAIQRCLHETNSEGVATIFQSCVIASTADASAATNAKQHFSSLYNQLRRAIGLPSGHLQF